jgi:hypothetical protein
MPVSRRDEQPLRSVAQALHEIADLITRLGDEAGKSDEGRDHSKALGEIRESLAEIATALRGFSSRR